jgi:spore maturation protein SpmB
VTILQFTPLINYIGQLLAPLMSILGLPPEAALALVLSAVLNLYAGIGAILSLTLTVKQAFIIAVMISISHNLIVESSVGAKVGLNFWLLVLYRIFMSLVAGILINYFWTGGQEKAVFGFISTNDISLNGYSEIFYYALKTASLGVIQLIIFVIPIMMIIQFLKETGWIKYFVKIFYPFIKIIGVNKNATMTFVAGMIFGLAYGAGVMIQENSDGKIKYKDLLLIFIFLSSCHAIIEDTLLFIPIGIPIIYLLIIRIIIALISTLLISFFINMKNKFTKGAVYENNNSAI